MELEALFEEFHFDVVKMITETPRENIFFSDIIDLEPISNWQKGKVCLVGDAAHATTPNLGQGACQAVEDAYTIGKLFEKKKAAEEVFKEYEKLRRKKAHYIVNRSWTMGKVSHYKNSTAIWLRNALLKTAPKWVNEKQLDKIFDISYI